MRWRVFISKWLDLRGLDELVKDSSLYPAFDPDLIAAMRGETVAFADHVLRRGDGSIETLLTAGYSFLTPPLFALYGVAEPPDHDSSTPTLLPPGRRMGLLTHASVLAAQAHVGVSSPTLRGKLIRENFLCQNLPDPPPDVDTSLPEPAPGSTTRERFALHQAPACVGCHRLIDDIGFGFEHYDAIGAWRDLDGGAAIDAQGHLRETDVDGAFNGAIELARRLAGSRQVKECLARQWFRFALGRLETPADGCSLAHVYDRLEEPDNARAILRAIATSDAFRLRRSAGEE